MESQSDSQMGGDMRQQCGQTPGPVRSSSQARAHRRLESDNGTSAAFTNHLATRATSAPFQELCTSGCRDVPAAYTPVFMVAMFHQHNACARTYTHTHTHTNTHTHTHTHTHMYLHICIYAHLCMYSKVYTDPCVHMYVYTHTMSLRTHVTVQVYTHS